MEENIKNEFKSGNGKGIKVLLVILIILVLAVLALLVYKLFVVDKNDDKKVQNTTVESSSEKSTNENTASVPVEDTFAQFTEVAGNIVVSYTYTLQGGEVYESKVEKELNHGWARFYSSYTIDSLDAASDIKSYNTFAVNNLSKIKNLPSIKRIKGLTVTGSGDGSEGLLLVTEDGKVLIYKFRKNGTIENAQFLDDYKVEDIVGYFAFPNCVTGPEDVNFKTCGGEYNIIDKDGNTHHYQVNIDGSLTQK